MSSFIQTLISFHISWTSISNVHNANPVYLKLQLIVLLIITKKLASRSLSIVELLEKLPMRLKNNVLCIKQELPLYLPFMHDSPSEEVLILSTAKPYLLKIYCEYQISPYHIVTSRSAIVTQISRNSHLSQTATGSNMNNVEPEFVLALHSVVLSQAHLLAQVPCDASRIL